MPPTPPFEPEDAKSSAHPVQDHTIVLQLRLHMLLPPHRRANAIQALTRLALVQPRPRLHMLFILLESISLLRPVDRKTDICAGQRKSKQDKLDQEPRPAAPALPLARHAARLLPAL